MKTTLKICSLILLLLVTGMQMKVVADNPPKTFPLSESFETGTFPPAGWNIYDVDGQAPVWELSEWLNHTPDGYNSAYHGYGPGLHDGWMVSPQLAIPATGQKVLAFWSNILDSFYYYKNSILVSTGSGDPASGDFAEVWTPAQAQDGWRQYVIDLEAYAGQTIYIAFRYEGDYAHGWSVDDIYIGNDFNMNPVITASTPVLNATGPINVNIQKNLTISNTGINNLSYTMAVYYNGPNIGWMELNPLSGELAGGDQMVHTAVFNPTGLQLGTYTASITIQSNDPATPTLTIPVTYEVIEASSVGVSVMIPEYTFPYDISENGQFVAISGFGTGGWLWSQSAGLVAVNGDEPSVIAVSEQGVVAGTSRNPAYTVDGLSVQMAGYWHPQTQEWTFLPLNPAVGEPVFSDYNSAWGMTADGSVIVGMQFYADYGYRAFKYSQANGYEMIGDVYPAGNRPNGISNDGSVVFGWANLPMASRSPVIWHNGSFIQISPDDYGEASASSPNGQYVTGYAGEQGFVWTPQGGTTFFPNSLGGSMSPAAVMNDGTVFGYYSDAWPPFPDTRRAFARLITGEMMSFNDYALSRGMATASEWIFYSINGTTPDGNKLIGAGINPDGQNVSFIIDFGAEIPSIVINPASLVQALNNGGTATQTLTIQNTGTGTLDYSTYLHFINNSTAHALTAVPAFSGTNPTRAASFAGMRKAKTAAEAPQRHAFAKHDNVSPASNSNTGFEGSFGQNSQKAETKSPAGKGTFALHYDGDNVDAIGLVEGGSFFHAARYPQSLVAPFVAANITQVELYINDLPEVATMYIWGPGTTGSPGEVLLQQTVSVTAQSWNTITLATPLTLTGDDIWIGFGYTHPAGTFIAGIDGGPLNPNGDFLREASGEWERLSMYGFNSNWNIRATLQLGDGSWLSLNPTSGSVAPESSQEITATFTGNVTAGQLYHANIIVTSNDMSNPLKYVPVTLDMLLGLKDSDEAQLKIYPVPAHDAIHIESVGGIQSVSIMNQVGQKVAESAFAGALQVKLSVNELKAGAYMIEIKKVDQSRVIRPVIIK